jgi:hypothetical protein
MKETIARLLHQAADAAGIELLLREDYSGRGMFGKSTFAVIVASPTTLYPLIAEIASQKNDSDLISVTMPGPEDPEADDLGKILSTGKSEPQTGETHEQYVDFSDFSWAVQNLQVDGMGKDVVIY